MHELLHRSLDLSVRAMNVEARSVDVVASTPSLDAYSEVVVQDWDLERYKKNPVVLYGHNSYCLPIGHAENVRVEKGQLLATLFFVDARANPLAEQVWQGIQQKSLRAVSVGFRCDAASQQEIDGEQRYVLTGNELVEISVVPIPANPDCVALEARSLDLIKALANERVTSEKTMSNVLVLRTSLLALTVLGLTDASTDAEIVDKVKSVSTYALEQKQRADAAEALVAALEGKVKSLVDATGCDGVDKALGAIAAGKDAILKSAEQAKQLEQAERAAVIAKAKADKKLTPAQETALEGKSLDFVKSFVELQVPNPTLVGTDAKEPTGSTLPAEFVGKKWEDLKPMQKHGLLKSHPEAYEALKGDFEQRTAAR